MYDDERDTRSGADGEVADAAIVDLPVRSDESAVVRGGDWLMMPAGH